MTAGRTGPGSGLKQYLRRFDELAPRELYRIMKARVDVFVVEQNCPYAELDDLDQEAQTYARGFYEKEGFRAFSDEFILDGIGIPHVRMIRGKKEE